MAPATEFPTWHCSSPDQVHYYHFPTSPNRHGHHPLTQSCPGLTCVLFLAQSFLFESNGFSPSLSISCHTVLADARSHTLVSLFEIPRSIVDPPPLPKPVSHRVLLTFFETQSFRTLNSITRLPSLVVLERRRDDARINTFQQPKPRTSQIPEYVCRREEESLKLEEVD